MCKVLQGHGWQLDRISGSHHIFNKPGVPNQVSVSVHGNQALKKGTQRGIMKQAGLTDDDL
jgi:predicted RNA binding protein YcfA (HicA-like mRNA interferase family)